jgi:hypothetical protein
MNNRNGSQRLVGEVQMFRIRVAAAESKLKLLRDQAREARRRRKEAKRAAQRARKQFKRFKADLAELQEALAKAEAKLFQAGGRALARKLAKARPVTKGGARPAKKSKPAGRRSQPAPRASRAPGRVTRHKPKIEKTNAVAENPVDAAAPDGTPPTPEVPGTNSVTL